MHSSRLCHAGNGGRMRHNIEKIVILDFDRLTSGLTFLKIIDMLDNLHSYIDPYIIVLIDTYINI